MGYNRFIAVRGGNMKFIIITALVSLFGVGAAHADGWYSDSTIEQLQYSLGANGVHIFYSGGNGNANPDSCDVNGIFILPYATNGSEREKAMLTGISMAFTAGKKVDIFLLGCMAGIGGKTYPKVYYLKIKR